MHILACLIWKISKSSHIDELAQDCSNFSALAMEMPQSHAKPSTFTIHVFFGFFFFYFSCVISIFALLWWNMLIVKQLVGNIQMMEFFYDRLDWLCIAYKQCWFSFSISPCIHRWLHARLQYLQCISNGDTSVLHWAIEMWMDRS